MYSYQNERLVNQISSNWQTLDNGLLHGEVTP